ncbi:dTMP kinase [Corynebacterium pseudotuberculosis]|uniref:Thymidylate kinase n=1 Tax=Corynebacterium pseudotuberculosis (strain C231) TaxID=681645 RepID=D9QET2_CORP2|nr:dTMP kinase [Corynebacterium pseudotuberculosis]ADK28310.1 dTMP kinase [Corynebacterium pseudotuberculosis FRC41]ADL10005.1 dTMP kinase [Corynebacterium pseudotuberculosis C231]ADL20408.1 dTMP kinase [Corynebacterium pseudotuberculosis 1002]AEK91849.1 Thymidylate kinase [Corynebacterium pseudotuberculosis PAT10]AEP69774.1 Thymidylate kinase [Corynebacterium pseudotuberculosis 42/02-A]
MIIAIEGIDGAGKNTLVRALVEKLDARVLGFPRYQDSIHAHLAQKALYQEMGDVSDSIYAMALLFALDRREIAEELRSYKGSEDVILLDRYVSSNAAYSAARAQDWNLVAWVSHLEFEEFGLPTPDIQVLLNTSPEVAAQRAAKREEQDQDRSRDCYETDSSLQVRTSDAYARLAEEKRFSPWIVAQPGDSVDDVALKIIQTLGTM